MNPSDWAAWVQEVGSIAAIIGSFHIAKRQHEQERAADRTRRQEEAEDDLDRQVLARTLAIQNIVQVASHAIEVAGVALGHSRDAQPWEAEPFLLNMDQLRTVLDSLITPETEHLAVVSALEISQMLVQTRSDIRNLGHTQMQELINRSTRRIDEASALLNRLIQLQHRLVDTCRLRGIPLEIDELQPRG